MGQHDDILQSILWLQEPQKVLFAIVQHYDLIPGVLFQKEKLGRPCRRVMGHRVHKINELQQHPHGQDRPLIRLTERVRADVIPARDIRNAHLSFQIPQDLLRSLGRFAQQPDNLGPGQCSILGQPFYNILLILKQHPHTSFCAVRISHVMRIYLVVRILALLKFTILR